MADLVRQYLAELAKEKEAREKRSRGKEKRFTVTLSEYDYRRLRYIAKKLGKLRTNLARDLIVNALYEAEEVLKLVEKYDDPNEPFYGEYTEYGSYINSVDEDDAEDNDE